MIFETHAHYEDKKFDEDREELLSSLKDNGISYVVNIGSNMDTTKRSIELSRKYPFIYTTIGVHPNEVSELNDEKISILKQYSFYEKVVAIGEIGLDYYWNEPERGIQKYWFERQLNLAKETKLPVVIHSRDAAKDTLDIIKIYKSQNIGGIIHCFSYSIDMAKEYLNMGFYIGIGGVITFSNSKKLKEVVNYSPIENLVIETDSPYLAPVPNRGKRNTSLNLIYIIDEIAKIKGISKEEVIDITYKNAIKAYNIKEDKNSEV